jgi:hypothetical protein
MIRVSEAATIASRVIHRVNHVYFSINHCFTFLGFSGLVQLRNHVLCKETRRWSGICTVPGLFAWTYLSKGDLTC